MLGLIFYNEAIRIQSVPSKRPFLSSEQPNPAQHTAHSTQTQEQEHGDLPTGPKLCLEPLRALQGLLISLPTNLDVQLTP